MAGIDALYVDITRPKIDKIFQLKDANPALRWMKERKNIGKILLSCSR